MKKNKRIVKIEIIAKRNEKLTYTSEGVSGQVWFHLYPNPDALEPYDRITDAVMDINFENNKVSSISFYFDLETYTCGRLVTKYFAYEIKREEIKGVYFKNNYRTILELKYQENVDLLINLFDVNIL